jgi:predicted DNA-binding mobile mystery protein A
VRQVRDGHGSSAPEPYGSNDMKSYTFRMLALRQLDAALDALKPLAAVARPLPGWVATLRRTLGMNTRQLGERMGGSASSVSRIEKGEITGKVTLEAMSRAAEAMDCRFVYALIPNDTLESFVRRAATAGVADRAEYVNHHMALEDQMLDDERLTQIIQDQASELIVRAPHLIWDKPK